MDARDEQYAGTRLNEQTENSSTPEDTAGDAESKASRKREREISLEPATPQRAVTVREKSTDVDTQPSNLNPIESSAPAKKNRASAQLGVTEEEDESGPSVSCSPPTDSKIRQISQGVEDLTWKNMPTSSGSEGDHEMNDVQEGQAEPVADRPGTKAGRTEQRDDPEEEPMETKIAGGDEVSVPLLLLQGENPPMVSDGAGDDEHGGQADPAEVPPDAQPTDSTQFADDPEVHPEVSATSAAQPVPAATSSATSRCGSQSDSDVEKGVKRKLGDRTVSEKFMPDEITTNANGNAPKAGASKRQRDDAEADVNPRVTKRPTPPPEEEQDAEVNSAVSSTIAKKSTPEVVPSAAKLGGFMAFASTSSPFASAAGPSIFDKAKSPPPSNSPFASSTSSSSFPSPFATPSASPTKASTQTLETPLPLKRTGFEAFASAASPFASAAKRPKSPPPSPFGGSSLARSRSPSRHPTSARTANAFSSSAFSAYAAGGAQAFSAAKSRSERASPVPSEGSAKGTNVLDSGGKDDTEDENENNTVSFGERLRAQKDEEDNDETERIKLTEQEVHTGEEEEETVYQVRGKLYALSPQNQWKERGSGTLKLNVRRDDGTGARLVMRKEAVYTVLLNATLFRGMKCFTAQDPRYIRFSVFEGSIATHYNLRVQSAKVAEELLEEINSHIPSD